jgi:hypothetical protein
MPFIIEKTKQSRTVPFSIAVPLFKSDLDVKATLRLSSSESEPYDATPVYFSW